MVKREILGQQEGQGTQPGIRTKAILLIAVTAAVILIISGIWTLFFLHPQPAVGPLPEGNGSGVTVQETTAPATQQLHTQPVPLSSVQPAKKPVDFLLEPGEQTSCGLTCRQLTATITNTGDDTAHHVCITLSVHNSRGDVIGLNGEPSIRQCVGDIAPGERKSEPVTINADCGVFATKCIKETLTLETEVTSEEKNVKFPNQLIAV